MTYILKDDKDSAYYGVFADLDDLKSYIQHQQEYYSRFFTYTVIREDNGIKTVINGENDGWLQRND